MTDEIDKEAVDTMVLLDMEVRAKIRAVLLDMVKNPQDEEERAFVDEIVVAAQARHQMAQMRALQQAYEQQQAYAQHHAYAQPRNSAQAQTKVPRAPTTTTKPSMLAGVFGSMFGK